MPGWKYAFSLPSEAVKAATPPGTVLLIGERGTPSHPEHEAAHAHRDGRDVDRVVRFPTPTADPADPLNWPRWQKAACMVTLSLYAFVSNYISASIAPALPRWNYDVTCCGIPFIGFTPTLIIRIIQGLGSSASETVVPAVVGDLFFVHERGSWMAFYTASLASGSVVGGITGGYVAAELGWVGQFWIGTGLSGLAFLATVLLVPESMFYRDRQTAPVQRTLPPISRPGRPRIRSTAPKLSLMTLPSMRFTLPSRFRWRPPPDEDDEAALTCGSSSTPPPPPPPPRSLPPLPPFPPIPPVPSE
ncbi:hypothetical protein VTG60DRAFT_2338 [Thermothelomyces hinnuleus]